MATMKQITQESYASKTLRKGILTFLLCNIVFGTIGLAIVGFPTNKTETQSEPEVSVTDSENGGTSYTIILREQISLASSAVIGFAGFYVLSDLFALANYSWQNSYRMGRAWEKNRQLESGVEEAIREMEKKSRKWKKLVAPRAYHFQSIPSFSSKASICVN
ncbi:MAG: hypothetical protein ACFFER_08475 [Candidatus Thorarchaeota archaeon]